MNHADLLGVKHLKATDLSVVQRLQHTDWFIRSSTPKAY